MSKIPSQACLSILSDLIGFDTRVDMSNLGLIRYVHRYFDRQGIRVRLTPLTEDGKRNLFVSLGPDTSGGTVLAAHSDVSSEAFKPELELKHGVAYGTGLLEMKGFIACVLAQVPLMIESDLKRPLHFSLSYDETIGCLGLRDLLYELKAIDFKADQCLIGKPTGLQPILSSHGVFGHELVVESKQESYQDLLALSEEFFIALKEYKQLLESTQADIELSLREPVTNFSADGVNRRVSVKIRIRYPDGQSINSVNERLSIMVEHYSEEIEQRYSQRVSLRLRPERRYPPSAMSNNHKFAHWLTAYTKGRCAEAIDIESSSQGSEAGMYQSQLGIPTLLCGPGRVSSVDDAIELTELAECERLIRFIIAEHCIDPDLESSS